MDLEENNPKQIHFIHLQCKEILKNMYSYNSFVNI